MTYQQISRTESVKDAHSDSESGSIRITKAIRRANEEGRPALVTFLTAGFPDRSQFASILTAVAAESDVVEIGVPFSDPMADGVTIQRSSRIALEGGVSLPWILEVTKSFELDTPLILMSYLNPLLAFGFPKLAEVSRSHRIDGFIIPDLSYEESQNFRSTLDSAGLALIQLVAPVTPNDRMDKLCSASRGFVYAVTTTGTTGGNVGHSETTMEYLDRVRSRSKLPVLAGFGIRSASQVNAVATHSDGVIVGSALVEILERNEDPTDFLRTLRGLPVERKKTR